MESQVRRKGIVTGGRHSRKPAQRLLREASVMRKRHLVVFVFLVVASVVSYELVLPTEANPAAVELVEVATPGVAFKAAVVPLVMTSDSAERAVFDSISDSISDAVVLGATGAVLLVVAAGVRRRVC